MKRRQVNRGDIYYADLSPVVGSEQGGMRPVINIQNEVGNRHSPTIIVAAITSKPKTTMPKFLIYSDTVPETDQVFEQQFS